MVPPHIYTPPIFFVQDKTIFSLHNIHQFFFLMWSNCTRHSTHTGCPRRNVPNFGRVFLMLNYTDITQNTYIQSWTVTEIMDIEKCGLLGCPHTVRRPWRHTHPTAHARQQDIVMQWPWRMLYSTVALTSKITVSYGLREVLGSLRTNTTVLRLFL